MAVDRGAKSCWFPLMVYEEKYLDVMQNIEEYGYSYVAIKHDRDLTFDGNIKQLHYHFVILLGERESYQFTIAKQLGLANRFVQRPKCQEPNGAVRYLLHLDDPDKVLYSVDEVFTNLSRRELDDYFVKIEKLTKAEEVESVLKDIRLYSQNKIGLYDMLRKHPSFIYQIKSLLTLAEIAGDDNTWFGLIIDSKTGEIST